ncbi:MAG: LysR family transcriptional regulator [Zoogloea sp.]|nr:LysR family transcriptional regulator [Zoogloea sp.]
MRSKSFSLAADELCVTPGAIGQQIQKLEEWLGMPLFIRQVRQVQPTDAATGYWQKIQPALAQIADASSRLKRSRSMAVSLSMTPSFAAKWFTSRMADLVTRHPDIELHLNASVETVDFEREAVDLAIRHFSGKSANLDANLLFRDEARVYCTPEYAATMCLTVPEDLASATLLVTTIQPYWERWFKQFSHVDSEAIARIPRMHFDQSLLAIEAAKRGNGVVLASPYLTEAEVASQFLIEPFHCSLKLENGYYVVHPSKTTPSQAAIRVKQWLIEEASKVANIGIATDSSLSPSMPDGL